MPTRVLPNNLEAEESVLGACFLSKYALQKANESLTAESFYNEKNAVIPTGTNVSMHNLVLVMLAMLYMTVRSLR